MAYRDPTFNSNVITDLLSTYLSHNAQEREKYYKAEVAKKPTYKAFGDELLEYDSYGNFVRVARTKPSTSKALNTLYPVGEGPPVMTRQVGANTKWINPDTNEWEDMPPDVLGGYTTDIPKAETTLPYVTWNRKTDDGYQEKSFLKGKHPSGEGWSVGQAPKDTITGYVTWYKQNNDGTYEEQSVSKGTRPVGEEWVKGHAPKGVITPPYKIGQLKEFKVGDKIVNASYTGLDSDVTAGIPGWKEGETTTRFKEGFAVWNRINPDTGLPEETTLKDTERPPENEDWNLGKAGDPLGYVTWNRLNEDGSYSETSKKKGYRPSGIGWSEGQAPSASVDLTDNRTRKAAVQKMARAERDYLKNIKDGVMDPLHLKPQVPWDPDTMLPAIKYYNAVLRDPDKWMKANKGLPVYGRIAGVGQKKFQFK